MNAVGLAVLWRRRVWILWGIGIISFLPPLFSGIGATTQAASQYTADTLALHKMVTYLAQNVPTEQVMVIVADPRSVSEQIVSLPIHLRFAGSKSPIHVSLLSPAEGYKDEQTRQVIKDITQLVPDVDRLTPNQIVGALIMLAVPTNFELAPDKLNHSAWQEITFTEPYYTFLPQKLTYTQVGEASYSILAPGEPLSKFPANHPLITIASALKGKVGINPWLKTPPWGINPAGGPDQTSSVWLGHGQAEGFAVSLWSAVSQPVILQAEVAPGPSRDDSQRTIQLTINQGSGETITYHETLAGPRLVSIPIQLQPGRNEFHITVLEEPTISILPNGDPRPLLLLLSQIKVDSLPETP